MLNPQLTALIPDQPYTEFTEVRSNSLPLLRRWFMQTALGFQGVGRRVWTNGDTPTVLDVSVTRVHSHSDAEQMISASRPTRVISELANFDLTVTDTPDGICTATWHNAGLAFFWLTKAVRSFAVEVELASPDAALDAEVGRQVFADLESSLRLLPESHQASVGAYISVIWSLAYMIPYLVLFIFGGYAIGYFLGPDPLPLITMLIGGVLFIRTQSSRWAKSSRARLLSSWSKMCQTGDLDGTVARALAATGHPLHTLEPQATEH